MRCATQFSMAPVALLMLLSGCQSPPCSVAPPASYDTNRQLAIQAGVDLTKFAQLPMSANFKAEASQVFKATFQKVPDTAAACAMLNQTYICISDEKRASAYMEFMRETNQCLRQ